MKGLAYIYKITSPVDKIYVGKTTRLKSRLNAYLRYDCKNQKHLHRSLLKYGFENHKFEIIHTLPNDIDHNILNDYEIFYISQYKACGFEMMNIAEGGGGVNGYKHSLETRKKISILSKRPRVRRCGYKHSEETKRKMSATRFGLRPSEESRLKMSISQKARHAKKHERAYNG